MAATFCIFQICIKKQSTVKNTYNSIEYLLRFIYMQYLNKLLIDLLTKESEGMEVQKVEDKKFMAYFYKYSLLNFAKMDRCIKEELEKVKHHY